MPEGAKCLSQAIYVHLQDTLRHETFLVSQSQTPTRGAPCESLALRE